MAAKTPAEPTEDNVVDGEYEIEPEDTTDDTPSVAMAIPNQPPAELTREAIGGMLKPVAEPAAIMAAQEETRALIEEVLVEGRDYGKVPGTNKDTLLKPGAERTAAAYGCHARFTIRKQEVDHDRVVKYIKKDWEWHPTQRGKKVYGEETEHTSLGLYRYVVACELHHRASGFIVGSGLGSCSTMETKYIDRPRDLENTVLKMAKKRAFVDAVLTTFGLSDQFTQDTEDMPRDHFGKGNGGGNKGPFSLTQNAVGKHKEITWQKVCELDPDYAAWCIGRKNGDGMDTLDEDARKVLGDELDRLAEHFAKENQDGQAEAPQGSTQKSSADPTRDQMIKALGSEVTAGKHKGKTWLEVVRLDRTYFDKAMGFPWGRKAFAAVPNLGHAADWICKGGDPFEQPEAQKPIGPPSAQFITWTHRNSLKLAEWQMVANAHPDLPSDLDEWDEEHYAKCLAMFVKHGKEKVVDGAETAMAKSNPDTPPGVEAINSKLLTTATAVLDKMQTAGFTPAQLDVYDKELQACKNVGDNALFSGVVEKMQGDFFAHKATQDPGPAPESPDQPDLLNQ